MRPPRALPAPAGDTRRTAIDPDQCLDELLAVAQHIVDAGDADHSPGDPNTFAAALRNQDVQLDDVYTFAEQFVALHEWLAKGGALPEKWDDAGDDEEAE